MRRRTLAFRLAVLSSLWILPAMGLAAAALVWSYHDHIAEHFDDHAISHVEELLVASRFGPGGAFRLAAVPSDPRFDTPGSGWYWEVRYGARTVARSPSLQDATLQLESLPEQKGMSVQRARRNGETVRTQVLTTAAPDGTTVAFITSVPAEDIAADVRNFAGHIFGSFALLGAGLVLAVVFQVRAALVPMRRIGQEINEIRAGRRQKLEGPFLRDVQPLANELNDLLEHNAVVLTRARNQLGDLAHAVKNPLTVINNEAARLDAETRDTILQQVRDVRASVEHHLARARSFGRVDALGRHADVKRVVDDLLLVMDHAYRVRDLAFDVSVGDGCRFRGDARDLEEIVGNLLDNACKWARAAISLRCDCRRRRMVLTIEDDGPGIPEQVIDRVVQRGWKADESTSGHGLGLAIVRELVELYGGTLTLCRAESGGLQAVVDLPAV